MINQTRFLTLQTFDKATLPFGDRPSLPYTCNAKTELQCFGAEDEERQKARITDLTWLMSRICVDEVDPSVPSRRAMGEDLFIVDLSVTTMGMLPNLKAPAYTKMLL